MSTTGITPPSLSPPPRVHESVQNAPRADVRAPTAFCTRTDTGGPATTPGVGRVGATFGQNDSPRHRRCTRSGLSERIGGRTRGGGRRRAVVRQPCRIVGGDGGRLGVGRSSRWRRWRRRRRRWARPSRSRCRSGGSISDATTGRCGDGAAGREPSRTRRRSITSTSPGAARAPAASCRASTPSPCSSCGCAAWCPRRRRRRPSPDGSVARAGRADGPAAKPVAETGPTGPIAARRHDDAGTGTEAGAGTGDDPEPSDRPEPVPPIDGDRSRDERVARMREGLVELDRWLEDRIRTGLADPSLARYATWDDLAARLVDARAGALANRIRRLAGLVGSDPDWHARVLAEIGVLHLLAQAGQRLPDLPGALADSVATATGWQVRQADVLAGVPDTDRWIVAGRSDTREDRIEVRRTLAARRGERAVGDGAVVRRLPPEPRHVARRRHSGARRPASLPGPRPARARGRAIRRSRAARRAAGRRRSSRRATRSVARSRANRGSSDIPRPCWRRRPGTAGAGCSPTTPARSRSSQHHARWPRCSPPRAASPPTLTVEWTPHGVIPLTVHAADRALDVGPVADPSFVEVA